MKTEPCCLHPAGSDLLTCRLPVLLLTTKPASMAAKHFYRKGFLLLLFNFISTAALEKRFSDFKRCADEECSMLLCRGKAVEDFSGPDCRFLSFKKSETVYVYYKLSGRRADMWAGSVGSHFGYFPMDLLAVNHVYTDKEVEVPTEETDFVCFDTGLDQFDNYEIDSLLGFSTEEINDENKRNSDQPEVPQDTVKDTSPPEETMVTGDEIGAEYIGMAPDDQSASFLQLDLENESQEEVPDTEVTHDGTDNAAEDKMNEQITTVDSFLEDVEFEKRKTHDVHKELEEESLPKDDPVSEHITVSTSEGEKISKLKTTFGSTFDAVTTNAEATTKVTPYEHEENEVFEGHSEQHSDADKRSFSEEEADTSTVGQKDNSKPDDEKVVSMPIDDSFSDVSDTQWTEQEISSEDWEEEQGFEIPLRYEEPQEDIAPENVDPVLGDSEFVQPKENEDTENIDPFHTWSLDSLSEHPRDPTVLENLGRIRTDSPDSLYVDPRETVVEELLFDLEDDGGGLTIKHEDTEGETPQPTDEPVHQGESTVHSKFDPLSHEVPQAQLHKKLTDRHSVNKEVTKEVRVAKEDRHDRSVVMEDKDDLKEALGENKTEMHEEFIAPETNHDVPSKETPSLESFSKPDDKTAGDGVLLHEHLRTDFESDHQQVEPHIDEESLNVNTENPEMGKEGYEGKEDLLEDENALSFSQSYDADTVNSVSPPSPYVTSIPEQVYSDSVLRLTLLQGYYTEEKMLRLQKFLGLKNLYKVESMFSDMDTELQATRRTHSGTVQDLEDALENILETSENTILDEVEKMLDSRHSKYDDEQRRDMIDDETEILDDFQELAFSLRQKYSAIRDSTPLAEEKTEVNNDQDIADQPDMSVKDNLPHIVEVEKEPDDLPHIVKVETNADLPEMSDDNHTVTELQKQVAEIEKEVQILDEGLTRPDVEEDAGRVNKNKENQPSFSTSDELQKFPLATLESPFEKGLGDVDHSFSGSLDSMEPPSEFHEEDVGFLTDVFTFMGCAAAMIKARVAEWTILMISLLPEEWKPGETLFGCPWQAVIVTAVVGVLTFTIFFWKTVLAVKRKKYLVDEKHLADQIQALKQEKNDALTRMSELQKQTEDLKETHKESAKTVCGEMKKTQKLEIQVLEAEKRYESMVEEKKTYQKLLDEEKENSVQIGNRIKKLEKSNEKLELSRKKVQEALAKTTVLLDEAKIREDARSVQHKCLAKEYAGLKEENKNLKVTIKEWEDKHTALSEQIKVYQKAQKDLEDSVVLKDHNVEVLSELLADLDACELQKSDGKVLMNGEVVPDKKTAVKNRIKQMMDVSRVQTTLAVIEEERDRFMSKLLNVEKSRKALEEKHQELEHDIATLKSEKSHVENQLNILQQKNEIMVEMHQQKENALQQRLTKEELERRSKESMLSEVGGKAVEAEEQVKVLRHRINEMEEQMKKTEEVYKDQIKEQENKTHSNWVNARNAERALNQEKLESSKLREKLVGLTLQLNERRAPLFRPNSGQAAGPRQGDSYGPSPVSGGAPSPPLMIEGPRRPPSAPVGRRIDSYGPRPPSDPHSRYPGMDMSGPRSSSPSNMDASQNQAVDPHIKSEAEASKEAAESGPGSFLASPIRDSPGPMSQGPPPPGPGLHEPLFPTGPHGRLPPGGPYRPLRPPLYHPAPGPHGHPPNVPLPPPGPPLPANGHPGMPLPGTMGGDFGPRPANGHAFHPRPGPGNIIDPRGPPPPPFRPPPPHHFGPMPHGPRGLMGPRPPFPPDMRFPGPREHSGPSADLPPGVPPHLGHNDAFGQPLAGARHISAGGPPPKQEASVRPAMVEP
ncbi:transport and Golgi organization protein 1 homolog isoform X1 [Phyllopteryx taeniolatus]|uniref:transport and Golgi organization protein 1 homolog isoform X1 n=1 Tax=Phyllopteryx taeniolatus TaxID=161469 RepID=UPI002AD2A3A8|nr:transport and Golgi organization protein 1 homolog isoform X1 [Phyllopteryx taeniolatus]